MLNQEVTKKSRSEMLEPAWSLLVATGRNGLIKLR